MVIQELLHRPVVTVDASTRLSEAYQVMRAEGIRHLPVLEGPRLVGVITDRDLRGMTHQLDAFPFEQEATVADLMATPPITAGPLDPVEEAARVMRDRKIGCLPILDGDALVGMVTVTDLLDAIVRLTGVARPGGRLTVRLGEQPGRLARLTVLLSEHKVFIRSILTYPEDDQGHVRTILRVNTIDTSALAVALRAEGFDVVWPPAHQL